MVDYSKWDRMEFSDSDNDEGGSSGPRVTSLDRPGRVTIGRDGSLEIGKSSSTRRPSTTQTQTLPTVSGSVSGDVVDISSRDTTSSRPDDEPDDERRENRVRQWRSRLTRNGGEHSCTVATADGEETKLPVYWSQDLSVLTLRLGFPPELFPTRGIRVRVRGALGYADRSSAVATGRGGAGSSPDGGGAAHGSVEIVSLPDGGGEETVLLAGELPRPIHLRQDEEEVDHEIEDNLLGGGEGGCERRDCAKVVTIEMPKAVPMAGVVLWWDRPLEGFPPIDVSSIRERNGADGRGEDGKKEAFNKAWEEAHEMFREKMKTKKKHGVEVDD